MILSLLSLSHRWAAIWALSSLRASRSTAWKPSPTPPEWEILNFALGNLRHVRIVLDPAREIKQLFQTWSSLPPPGSTNPQLEKLRLLISYKIGFLSSLIFRTWGLGYFDTRWSGLGCPTLPHAPGWKVMHDVVIVIAFILLKALTKLSFVSWGPIWVNMGKSPSA